MSTYSTKISSNASSMKDVHMLLLRLHTITYCLDTDKERKINMDQFKTGIAVLHSYVVLLKNHLEPMFNKIEY